MIRMNIREPIYLTKLKKKDKVQQPPFISQAKIKESIKYDLQVHHEPLNTQTTNIQEKQSNSSKIHQSYTSINFTRPQSQGIQTLSNRQIQMNQTIINGQDLSFRQRQHINKTTASLRFSENTHINKQNAILYQPQLINLKARAVNTINNTKAYALKETKPINHLQAITQIYQENQIQNEKRIKQLEQLNQQANEKIKSLQNKLRIKEQMNQRVENIERDLDILYHQNQQLYKINESLSKIQNSFSQVQMQTDVFPLYVQDAYCQTQAFEPQRPKMLDLTQFQRQRIMLANRQKEYKITIQNMRIENRQMMDRLRDQMDSLTMKYEGKCQEVKDKESLITRYLLK